MSTFSPIHTGLLLSGRRVHANDAASCGEFSLPNELWQSRMDGHSVFK